MRIVFLMLSLSQASLASVSFLTISDIHYGSDNKLIEYQDSGDELLSMAMEKFTFLSKEVDFILFLGDIPTHALFIREKKEQYEKIVFHELFAADSSLKPMFYIPGNNDSLTGNYHPFESDGKTPLNLATDWTGPCVYCDNLIIDNAHIQHGGYYSSYVMPNNKEIILLALNTIQFAKQNIFYSRYPNQEKDALEQLDWLDQQMQKNHAKQLIIAMHIPPGLTFTGHPLWEKSYLSKFEDLLEKHHKAYNQITLLISHMHMDDMRKIELKDGVKIYAYSTPSISRFHGNNSGMKIFNLDANLAIGNYTTYYTSKVESWDGESYQALGASNAIFPNCLTEDLASCLNKLSNQQICSNLESGLFFGVKSDRVNKNVCKTTFLVK